LEARKAIAGHAGECKQPLRVHGNERTDDVVRVSARTEISAMGHEHHGLHIIGIA
jgi:hypothetical protein